MNITYKNHPISLVLLFLVSLVLACSFGLVKLEYVQAGIPFF